MWRLKDKGTERLYEPVSLSTATTSASMMSELISAGRNSSTGKPEEGVGEGGSSGGIGRVKRILTSATTSGYYQTQTKSIVRERSCTKVAHTRERRAERSQPSRSYPPNASKKAAQTPSSLPGLPNLPTTHPNRSLL